MLVIPLTATASQSVRVTLGQQDCTITVVQKSTGMFVDLDVAGVRLVSGSMARDRVRLVRAAYIGFIGDLAFVDTQGKEDPEHTGLGSRWVLVYLESTDAAGSSADRG